MYNLILEGTDAVTSTSTGASESVLMIVMMLGFVAVMYLVIFLPQKRKDKQLKEQMDKLCVGDKVATIGGLVGLVAHIGEDEVTIYTSAANTPVTFTKAAIQTVVPRNPDKSDPKKDAKKDKKESRKKASKDDKKESAED